MSSQAMFQGGDNITQERPTIRKLAGLPDEITEDLETRAKRAEKLETVVLIYEDRQCNNETEDGVDQRLNDLITDVESFIEHPSTTSLQSAYPEVREVEQTMTNAAMSAWVPKLEALRDNPTVLGYWEAAASHFKKWQREQSQMTVRVELPSSFQGKIDLSFKYQYKC